MQAVQYTRRWRNDIIAEIKRYFQQSPLRSDNYVVLVHGSFASGDLRDGSDLDIIVLCDRYDATEFRRFRRFIRVLHRKFGLRMDEEIPYENKLFVTYGTVEGALALRPFHTSKGMQVRSVGEGRRELRSVSTQQRLVLNALTTPHIFVCGNQATYRSIAGRARKSIQALARALAGGRSRAEAKYVALTRGSGGRTGRNYLGYKTERSKVRSFLRRLLRA